MTIKGGGGVEGKRMRALLLIQTGVKVQSSGYSSVTSAAQGSAHHHDVPCQKARYSRLPTHLRAWCYGYILLFLHATILDHPASFLSLPLPLPQLIFPAV